MACPAGCLFISSGAAGWSAVVHKSAIVFSLSLSSLLSLLSSSFVYRCMYSLYLLIQLSFFLLLLLFSR